MYLIFWWMEIVKKILIKGSLLKLKDIVLENVKEYWVVSIELGEKEKRKNEMR